MWEARRGLGRTFPGERGVPLSSGSARSVCAELRALSSSPHWQALRPHPTFRTDSPLLHLWVLWWHLTLPWGGGGGASSECQCCRPPGGGARRADLSVHFLGPGPHRGLLPSTRGPPRALRVRPCPSRGLLSFRPCAPTRTSLGGVLGPHTRAASGRRPHSPRTRNVFPPLHLSKSYLSSQDTPQMSFQMSSSRVIFRSYKSGRVGLPLKASVVPTELPTRPEGPARPPHRALATACPALRALLSPRGAAPPVLHEASSVSAAKSEFKYDRI